MALAASSENRGYLKLQAAQERYRFIRSSDCHSKPAYPSAPGSFQSECEGSSLPSWVVDDGCQASSLAELPEGNGSGALQDAYRQPRNPPVSGSGEECALKVQAAGPLDALHSTD